MGFEATEPVIELVAERADWPVRAVGTGVAQVRSPEVVGQQVQPGGGLQDVRIAQDGASASDKYRHGVSGGFYPEIEWSA